MGETIRQRCGSTFKNRKKGKIRRGIDSIGNVRVQRYARLICAHPSLTFFKSRFFSTHVPDDKVLSAHGIACIGLGLSVVLGWTLGIAGRRSPFLLPTGLPVDIYAQMKVTGDRG
jgi:hypothetical protein